MRTAAPSLAWLLASLAIASAASPPAPSFLARRDYTLPDSEWVQVADLNGDGIPDLIGDLDGDMEVLLGNGKGTFSPGPSTITVMPYVPSFVAVDVNGDGIPDLVMAGGSGPVQWGVGVSLGNGDGTFQTGTFYPAGTDTDIGRLAVGDFNGDGIPDIVTAASSGVWLFTGKGDGTFNSGVLVVPLATAGDASIAAADFNGDGYLDFVVTLPANGPGAGFAVVLGNGDGTFQNPQTFGEPMKALGLAVGSLTKGDHPSIALSAYGTTAVYLYFGNGAGEFSGLHYADLPGAGNGGLAIGDVNGDGIPDLVSESVYIALGNGNGTFKAPIYYPVQAGEAPSTVVLADLVKKGSLDIVTDSTAAISVLLATGNGKYEDGEWTAVTGGAGCGAAADYNGDGKPDLAVNNNAGISILLGTGSAASPFSLGSTIALVDAGCLVTGDLNGDGIPDLLIPVNDTAVAYLGNGDGTFTYAGTTATPTGGYVVLADFNHDGKLDFATSGNLLALGNSDGTFQTPAPFVTSPPYNGFQFIATGDLNNDGWPDVVLTNEFNDFIYVLLNNQQGGFTQTVMTVPFFSAAQIALADLNGDGNLDAVIGASGGGANIYLGNGQGVLTYLQRGSDEPRGRAEPDRGNGRGWRWHPGYPILGGEHGGRLSGQG